MTDEDDGIIFGPRPEPPPVLPVLGLLTADQHLAQEAAEEFARGWGEPDIDSGTRPFDHTTYYEKELGPGLQRCFRTFTRLQPAEVLPQLKERAWRLERHFQRDGKRRVNLDPGFLDGSKVVLASFKAGPQKLYLGDAVWADMVLFYSDGAYRPLPWTFPDLREGPYLDFFTGARGRYRELLRRWRREQGQNQP